MIESSKSQSKSAQEFFQKAEQKFLGKAFKIEQIPKSFLPAFFFAGRSNVGKSSLINKLLYLKDLLRTSKIPGCTIQLHFQQSVGNNPKCNIMVDIITIQEDS